MQDIKQQWLLPVKKRPHVRQNVITILARIIHERFYCNRRYAAMTSLAAGTRQPSGQARPVRPQRTARVRLGRAGLRVPVSRGVSAVSSRTVMNNVG
jgi:hypothetical protein